MADNDDLGLVPATPLQGGNNSNDLGLVPAQVQGQSAPASPQGWLGKAEDLATGMGGQILHNLNPIAAVENLYGAFRHPENTANGIVESFGNDYDARHNLRNQAISDFQGGNYYKSGLDALDSAVPFLGPSIANAGQSAQNGDYSQAGKVLGNLATPEVARVLPSALAGTYKAVKSAASTVPGASDMAQSVFAKMNPSDPHSLIMSALKPSVNQSFQFRNSLNRAAPDLKAAEAQLGRPIASNDDLIGDGQGSVGAVQIAKAANRKAYNSLFPNGGVGVDLSPVADAMKNSITSKMRLENPSKAAEIEATADKYRGTFPVEDVGKLLQETNGELDSYYGKNPAAKKGAVGMNPDTASLVSQSSALRKALYDTLDAPGQSGAAKELQQRWGALNDVENAAMNRRNVMLRQAPENLAQQLSKIQSGMKLASGAAKIASAPFVATHGQMASGLSDIGQAVVGTKLGDYLRQFNSTDGLLKRAFQGYDKTPSPLDMPGPFKPAGLLEPGAIRMPGAADTSGPIPNAGPYMGRGISPDVGSRLLPQPEGPIRYHGGKPDDSGPIEQDDLPRNAGYHTPYLTPKQKMLNAAAMFSNHMEPLGSRYGDATDLVQFKNPHTGAVQYIPKWMTEQLKDQ